MSDTLGAPIAWKEKLCSFALRRVTVEASSSRNPELLGVNGWMNTVFVCVGGSLL